MSIKAKGPPIDAETKARQKIAEQRAEAGRIEATQETLSDDTRAVIRNFGRLAAASGGSGGSGGGPRFPGSLLPVAGVSGLSPSLARQFSGGRLAARSLI